MNIPHIIEEIYDIFIDYFGEDRVDLQPFTRGINCENISADWAILVHWPEVIVTNEYDESVIIWHLWSKILINNEGRLMQKPLFNRSEYNQAQWNSDYAHSHLPSINKRNITEWRDSCLGVGPINVTIAKLKGISWGGTYEDHYRMRDFSRDHFYEDMDIWRLFVWELDKYVHIESVSGVPYKHLKDIGISRNGDDCSSYIFCSDSLALPKGDLAKLFLKYVIKSNVLKYNYINGGYSIGMPFVDTVVLLSNLFIKWYNTHKSIRAAYPKTILYSDRFLQEVYIIDGKIFYKYSSDCYSTPLIGMVGMDMFTFKGETIKLTANGVNTEYRNTVLILNMKVLGYIIYKILRFINCKYGKSEYTTSSRVKIF